MSLTNQIPSRPSSVAIVTTEHASRYLQQLCKHWAHKFAVEFDPWHGEIKFSDTQHVSLLAKDGALQLTVIDSDAAGLPNLEQVVADHIQRFAFRESLVFDWVR